LWSEKRRVDGAASVATASGKLHFHRRTMYTSAPIEEQAIALASLPLDDNEISGLQTLFPDDFL
jgi:hypothetical protein